MSVELQEERDFLLRSLDDLERERAAGDIDDHDYRALKDEYTSRAAAAIRALEAEASDDPPAGDAVADVEPEPRRRIPVKAIASVLAVLAVAGLAGGLVARSAGERLPGESVSGTVESSRATELGQAQQLIGEGRFTEALKLYDRVLEADPRNLEALTYRGWIIALAGGQSNPQLIDRGLASINEAIAVDPRYPDAHVFKGLILLRYKNDPAAAVPEFRTFLASDPPPGMVPMVEGVLNEALAASGQAPPPTP